MEHRREVRARCIDLYDICTDLMTEPKGINNVTKKEDIITREENQVQSPGRCQHEGDHKGMIYIGRRRSKRMQCHRS